MQQCKYLKYLILGQQLHSRDTGEQRHRTCRALGGGRHQRREPRREEGNLREKASALLKTTVISVICFETASAGKCQHTSHNHMLRRFVLNHGVKMRILRLTLPGCFAAMQPTQRHSCGREVSKIYSSGEEKAPDPKMRTMPELSETGAIIPTQLFLFPSPFKLQLHAGGRTKTGLLLGKDFCRSFTVQQV